MKIDWTKLKYSLKVFVTPASWLRNQVFDPIWDKELWQLLVDGSILYVGDYEAVIGDHIVWIENYPYANGRLIGIQGTCSRKTALFLNDCLQPARIIQALKGIGAESPNRMFQYKGKYIP